MTEMYQTSGLVPEIQNLAICGKCEQIWLQPNFNFTDCSKTLIRANCVPLKRSYYRMIIN